MGTTPQAPQDGYGGDTAATHAGKPEEFSPFLQVGRSGLKQYSGFVLEEFVQTLRGQNGAKAYREILDNSALVGGIYRQIQLSMRQVERYVEPFSDDQEDVDRAKRVEQALDDMIDSWEDVMSEMCSMIPYGYAPMEIVYKKCAGDTGEPKTRSKYSDGVISWQRVALRAQDTLFRWQFDDDGDLMGFVQIPPPDFRVRVVPAEKLLLFRPSVEKGNPEGYSVLRSAWWDWIAVKRMTEFESISGGRNATGIPVMYIPAENLQAGATPEQKSAYAQAKKVVQNLWVDDQMGVVMPMAYDPDTKMPLWKLELLSVGRASEYDYDKVITRHEVRIAMSMLAGSAMLGHDKVGSFALANTKWDTELAMGLNAWLDAMYGVWNRHGIPRMYALNGWPQDKLCKLNHGQVKATDVQKLAQAALQLSQAGMALFPDEELENHIRAEAGWPERMPGEGNSDPYNATEGTAMEPEDSLQPQAMTPAGTGPGAVQMDKGHNLRTRRGAFQSRSGNVLNALSLLRDRRGEGTNDSVAHGFTTAEPPYDPVQTQHVEGAGVERVKLKDLIATQPTVRRDHVRAFIENPNMISPGQRALGGQLVDRPVVVRHGQSSYIHDGHHRLAARQLLGETEVMARVVYSPTNQGQPENMGQVKK